LCKKCVSIKDRILCGLCKEFKEAGEFPLYANGNISMYSYICKDCRFSMSVFGNPFKDKPKIQNGGDGMFYLSLKDAVLLAFRVDFDLEVSEEEEEIRKAIRAGRWCLR